ncbi:alpha/beta hydrolase [Novosphingobium sp. Gsoil 351]|uniref:alpha/beta hydrolase n=1 Tax=Novosphingobium sp. Gsoil 351 TaxID=2675225 RepID=UPI001E34E0E0|nr:alpha/beta hydrolase-fold protein [Novosphingobium sp. Gsoil 351]
MTDGNHVVGTAAQLTYFLELGQLAPPTVVVTVGYPEDNSYPSIVARNRDLTPTSWPEWDASYGKVLGLDCPPSGHSKVFRRFLIDEVRPAVEAEAGVDPSEWTLGGHSLGGLFAVDSLFAAPGAFRRYFAVGSSFWWHKPLLFDRAEQFTADPTPRDISVYLAAGELESAVALKREWEPHRDKTEWQEYLRIMGGFPDIVGDTFHMASILSGAARVRAKAQILPNETHGTAVFAALSQGIRWLNEPV